MPIFGTKNALSGYSWLRILKKLLSDLKSAPRIGLLAKLHKQTKMPKFRTKNALFGYF